MCGSVEAVNRILREADAQVTDVHYDRRRGSRTWSLAIAHAGQVREIYVTIRFWRLLTLPNLQATIEVVSPLNLPSAQFTSATQAVGKALHCLVDERIADLLLLAKAETGQLLDPDQFRSRLHALTADAWTTFLAGLGADGRVSAIVDSGDGLEMPAVA